jgi:hypothetical protein
MQLCLIPYGLKALFFSRALLRSIYGPHLRGDLNRIRVNKKVVRRHATT